MFILPMDNAPMASALIANAPTATAPITVAVMATPGKLTILNYRDPSGVLLRISLYAAARAPRSREITYGERAGTRTQDPCLKRALLYQLSYAPIVLTLNH